MRAARERRACPDAADGEQEARWARRRPAAAAEGLAPATSIQRRGEGRAGQRQGEAKPPGEAVAAGRTSRGGEAGIGEEAEVAASATLGPRPGQGTAGAAGDEVHVVADQHRTASAAPRR